MESRAAIQTKVNTPLIVEEIYVPNPKPDQVIVKMLATGVCHSQIHHMQSASMPRPMAMGHEGVGIATHIGRGVSHIAEGDHVIVTWVPRTPSVGRKDQELSGVTHCNVPLQGGLYTWAEDALVNSENAVKIDSKQATEETAIIGCAVLTGAGAVLNTAKVRPGQSVAIFGVGGIGISAIQMASLVQAYPIIAVDINDSKLEFAQKFGATHIINASDTDPVQAVLDLSGGGVDYALDAVGLRDTNEQILKAARGGGPGAENLGGMAILIGIPTNEIKIDPMQFVLHQKQYTGSLGATYPEKDFTMFLRWSAEGTFPLDKMITRRYELEAANQACKDLDSGLILGRSIITL